MEKEFSKETLESVKRGLEQSKNVEGRYIGSFEEYLNDEEKEENLDGKE